MVVLPSYPKALVRDDVVLIEYEDGKTIVWGKEDTSEQASLVAEQLDVEMKLLAYIQETAHIFLDSIYDSVTSVADDSIVCELMGDVLYHWLREKNIKHTLIE